MIFSSKFSIMSCLSRRFCSDFVSFYALFNHNQSFLEWFLMFSFLAVLFMIHKSTRPIQIVIYDWSTYLDFSAIDLYFFLFMITWIGFSKRFCCARLKFIVNPSSQRKIEVFRSMRKVDLVLHVSWRRNCLMIVMNWWINYRGFWKLVSFPIDISTLKLIIFRRVN